MRLFARLLGLIVVFTAVSCTSSPAPPASLPSEPQSTPLKIGVVSSTTAILPLLNTAYASQAPQVDLQFVVGNSSVLFADLDAGLLHAILVHHIAAENGRYFNPIALDGLVIITHPDNPVFTLTIAEIQAIFNGRIDNWAAVGGADQPIILLSREPEAGLHSLLRRQIMAEQPISPNALLNTGNEAMLTAVANNSAAIGFSSMSAAQNSNVKMMQVNGRSATPATTAAQNYPLTTPLYFVTASKAEPTGELRGLLSWLQSDAGQAQIGMIYGRIR
ncbi:MAG: hypothetical protein GY805_34255 [Chloroflexi bacterium]|nr:hypothetical protein [Chloroflexota bacterium]